MSRVAELTLKLLDGTLADAEGAELGALVETDPRASAEHLELLALEAELRALRTDFDLADATLAKIQGAQAERTVSAVLSAISQGEPPTWSHAPPRPDPQRGPRLRVGWAALAACAAAALVAVWFGARPGPVVLPPPHDSTSDEGQGFAKLSRKAGLVEVLGPAGDLVPVEEGSELPAGFTLRTGDESLAVVDILADQTRFEIESDTVVRFRDRAPENASKPQLFLAAGQLTATVPDRPGNRPLVVGTPVTDVFARGGLFVVSSAGPDSARVDIRSGQVELVRTVAPKPVPVGIGSALVTAGLERVHIEGSHAVDRVPARTLAFPGARDVIYTPDGAELWVGNSRAFTRWGATAATESSFYARRTEGIARFTRDLKHLVAFRGDRDDRVLIRTLPDGSEHAAVNARISESRFWAVAPDASWLAVVEPKPPRTVRLVDVATGEDRFQLTVNENIGCIASSPDGRVLAVGLSDPGRGGNNKVALLDAGTGARLSALPTQKKPVTAMAYSDDGRLLAVAFPGAVQIWDVRSRELLRTIAGFERTLSCLAFSKDTQRIAAGASDGSVWVWHRESGMQTQLIDCGARGVRSIAFAPDGKQLVTVPTGAPVAVWNVNPVTPPAAELQ